jgi:hypothetical protein
MGCYETILFKCPACGAQLEAQSKSGPCLLETFQHTSVPIDVAQDANRHAPFECECGKKWMFDIPPLEPVNLSLKLKEIE